MPETPPIPPAQSAKPILAMLVKPDPSHQQPTPTILGHVVLSTSIIMASVVLYGVSIGFIFTLARGWKVCPEAETGVAEPAAAVHRQGPTRALPDRSSTAPNAAADQQAATAGSTPQPTAPSLAAPQPELKQLLATIDQLKGGISSAQKHRLKTQVIAFQQAQQTACQIGIFFFANRNAALTVCTAAGILSISSLAFVSKNGWEDTNNAFINVGLTAGLVLFTTWTFSQLYGQGVNYQNQKAKVILATDMLNRIASATANGSDAVIVSSRDGNGSPKQIAINLSNPKDITALINALDDQLRILTNLDFGGDSSFAEESAKRFGGWLTDTAKPVLTAPTPKPAAP